MNVFFLFQQSLYKKKKFIAMSFICSFSFHDSLYLSRPLSIFLSRRISPFSFPPRISCIHTDKRSDNKSGESAEVAIKEIKSEIQTENIFSGGNMKPRQHVGVAVGVLSVLVT